MKRTIPFASLLLVAGCATSPIVKQGVFPHLKATLSPDGKTFETNADVEIKCRIQNVSTSPIQLDTFPLGSAILSVDVFDASGKRIPPIPPPMPPHPDDAHRYLKILRPGRSLRETYSLYVFSPPLRPGTYTARMRGIHSNEVTFTIRTAMGD